jgi:hypothetical protein
MQYMDRLINHLLVHPKITAIAMLRIENYRGALARNLRTSRDSQGIHHDSTRPLDVFAESSSDRQQLT